MFKSKRAVTAVMASALLLLFALNAFPAQAGFTASVRNTNNTVGTGTSFLAATQGAVTQCTSVPAGSTIPATTSFPCSNDQFPAAVAATGNSTAATVLTATGTAPFSSATYDALSCAPVKFDNARTTTHPLLVRGGVTFSQAGPITNSGSTLFNGTNTSGTGVIQATAPTDFSVGIWFKTTSASGALMGWSSSASNVDGGQYDRHLYFTSTGQLAFSTYSGGARTITSPAAYNNGAWHYAVVTADSAVTTGNSRLTLYVDGTSVATSTFAAAEVAENTTGYWHVGHARSTVADGYSGTGQYFNGTLSNFTIWNTTVLTAANVTAMRNSTTQALYQSNSATLNSTHLWPLNDTGLTTFAGPYPVTGATNPCAHIRATVGTAGKCLYPVLATACPALSSTYTLAGLGNAPTATLTPSLVGTSQTITTTLSRDTAYQTSFEVGLHLLVPIVVVENGFTQTFTWATNETII